MLHSSKTGSEDPCFQVEDGSSIDVQETKNAFQRSLAHNAFSRQCIESNVSAGDFGIMLGVSGKREHESSSSQASGTTSRNQEYYATFNFPRTRVFLDEEELQLSERCKTALAEIKEDPVYTRLQRFYKLFGHIFVTSVLLGGQQTSSKFAAALNNTANELQQDALRNAIGVQLNAKYVATSAKFSSEKGTSSSSNEQQNSSLSQLGMRSRGGNTLWGSDICKWCQTVGPSKNWRVIENETAVPIHDLIGKLPGWEHIPTLFKAIIGNREAIHRPWRRRLSFLLDGKPLCWIRNDGKTRLCPSKDPLAERAIFIVSSANGPEDQSLNEWRESVGVDFGQELKHKLIPDTPLIFKSYLPQDVSEATPRASLPPMVGVEMTYETRGALSPSIPVSSPARTWRFSLRRISELGQWNPAKNALPESPGIMSGDKVKLFCHSLGLGPFATFLSPPSSACAATCSDDCITFGIPQNIISPEIRQLVYLYDSYKLTRDDMDAFEKMGFISTAEFAPKSPEMGMKGQERDRGFSAEISAGASVGATVGIVWELPSVKEYTIVKGKKYRVDYKKLQGEPLRSAPLDWSKQRHELERQSLTKSETMEISKPVILTVLFE